MRASLNARFNASLRKDSFNCDWRTREDLNLTGMRETSAFGGRRVIMRALMKGIAVDVFKKLMKSKYSPCPR